MEVVLALLLPLKIGYEAEGINYLSCLFGMNSISE